MSVEDITNPLEYIECIIAFDVRDWCSDSRLSAIYAIVFGMSDDGYRELQDEYHVGNAYDRMIRIVKQELKGK